MKDTEFINEGLIILSFIYPFYKALDSVGALLFKIFNYFLKKTKTK